MGERWTDWNGVMGKHARVKALRKRPQDSGEVAGPGNGAKQDGDAEHNRRNALRLMARAAEESDELRFENAARLLQAAIRMDPENVDVMDALAEAFLELGEPERAQQCFLHSVRVQPDVNFAKYMYLAQLTSDYEQACSFVEHAMRIMERESEQAQAIDASVQPPNALHQQKKAQVAALCSATELLLGIAEQLFNSSHPDEITSAAAMAALDQRAELAAERALQLDPDGLEPLLTMANVRLSQGRVEEARTGMLHLYTHLQPLLQSMLDAHNDSTSNAEQPQPEIPSVDFRIAVGKQLCELAAWKEAIDVFDSVLAETDRNVEVWFLSALCMFQNGDVEECCDMLKELDAVRRSPEGFEGMLDFSLVDELEQNAKAYLAGDPAQRGDVDMT
ncbi:putative assembly chaperone of rpl4 [Porphyridium purpureum]|uniref:Putative assembly chaperone of rpl4 n=1 Tax=Porphyridium purpureum TaxID=35688 RepID=A0A5J4YKL6_PORPP|nr:putative assembly chaperone of rpl4 [Porphyridium purpureum]|eukprot:POR5732..scf291_13